MKINPVIILAALFLTVAASAETEDPAELGLRSADAQEANLDQFKQYSWSIDSKLSQAGEVKAHVVSNCHFNEKGEMVQEVEKAESAAPHHRGMRGRAEASKSEEVSAFLGDVISVTVSYAFMSKGQQVDFFDKATITEGTGDDAGKLIAVAKDVTVPGDKVTKWIDAKNMLPARYTFEAVVDEVPVTGEVMYRPIEGGPNVPRMATINIPSQQGVIEVEFLDYEEEL